jgi:hypothetical protein
VIIKGCSAVISVHAMEPGTNTVGHRGMSMDNRDISADDSGMSDRNRRIIMA